MAVTVYTKIEILEKLREQALRFGAATTMEDLPSDILVWYRAVIAQWNKWLRRGDSVAVYENQDMGHYDLGHKQFVSYGSPQAQLEGNEAPMILPDIGNRINYRYCLIGTYTGEALSNAA